MAAPSGIVWGSTVGDYGRIGIYVNVTTNNDTTYAGTIDIWFWSKWSVSDTSNTLYYDNLASSGSAKTSRGSLSISTTNDSSWSTSNQKKLKSYSFSYTKGTSAVKRYLYAKLANVDRVGGTMSDSKTLTVPKLASYTIAYNANGGTGAPANQTKWCGKALELSSTKPTRTGYSFKGWALSDAEADAGTWYYQAGGSCGKNENLTLYAVWEANTYTVKFNANGGSGAPANQTKTYGVTLKLSNTKPTRTNYNFLGWGTTASATTATYQPGGNYTANSAVTLYAIWELAYIKPRITNPSIERCEPNTLDDAGEIIATSAQVTFDYACDRTVTEIKMEWESNDSDSGEKTFTPGGTSGSISQVIGEGSLNLFSTYVVRIIVTDEVDSTKVVIPLMGMNIPVDILYDDNGPLGMSFGKPAELEGKADFEYEIYPRNGFSNILLEPETDLNNVMTPNTYIGENTSTYNYDNCPITGGTFTLEVAAGGDSGQRVQTLTSTRKDDFVIWKRFYYGGSWGDWTQEYTAAGNLLASPDYYMRDTQTVTLSQKISEQPNGIVLVFSLYDADAKAAKNQEFFEFFVPKYMVVAHSGCGHNFNMCGMFGNTVKYLYIHDDYIVGHAKNHGSYTIGGITYANERLVLRYVIGV